MFTQVMIISIVCGICCCLHFQARRHAWEDQFADRPIMLTHRPCVEMRHVPVAEASIPQEALVVQGEAPPGDAASVPTAAAVEYPLPPLPPADQHRLVRAARRPGHHRQRAAHPHVGAPAPRRGAVQVLYFFLPL